MAPDPRLEDCCEKFREEIKRALGGREELPDDWTTTTKVEVKRCKGGPIAYWPLGRRTVRGSPCLGHSIWKAGPSLSFRCLSFPELNQVPI